MKRNICYTCITNDYDKLKDPKVVSSDWDYVCFTDNPSSVKSNIWQVCDINEGMPIGFDKLDSKRKNRFIKTHPHPFLYEYEFSLYIDGNIQILNDLNAFRLSYCMNEDTPIYVLPHQIRNCTFQEFNACIRNMKDSEGVIYIQMKKYMSEHMPFNFGLSHNCIIGRYHNNEKCQKIMEEWWDEIVTYSYRDQLSLFYVLWKLNMKDSISFIPWHVPYEYFDYIGSDKHNKDKK